LYSYTNIHTSLLEAVQFSSYAAEHTPPCVLRAHHIRFLDTTITAP
jgi:hypothetical protein